MSSREYTINEIILRAKIIIICGTQENRFCAFCDGRSINYTRCCW